MNTLYPPGKSRHLRADSTAGVEKRLIERHHLWWMVQMRVEDLAVGQAMEAQQEVTSGILATSGAPEGDPRVLQIQTGRQQPASGLVMQTQREQG